MEPQATGSIFANLLPILVIFGIFYFLLIRPQQRQQKEWSKMLGELKSGDEVITNGGIIGKIISLKDNELELEIAPKTKITILRSAIASLKNQKSDTTVAVK